MMISTVPDVQPLQPGIPMPTAEWGCPIHHSGGGVNRSRNHMMVNVANGHTIVSQRRRTPVRKEDEP